MNVLRISGSDHQKMIREKSIDSASLERLLCNKWIKLWPNSLHYRCDGYDWSLNWNAMSNIQTPKSFHRNIDIELFSQLYSCVRIKLLPSSEIATKSHIFKYRLIQYNWLPNDIENNYHLNMVNSPMNFYSTYVMLLLQIRITQLMTELSFSHWQLQIAFNLKIDWLFVLVLQRNDEN